MPPPASPVLLSHQLWNFCDKKKKSTAEILEATKQPSTAVGKYTIRVQLTVLRPEELRTHIL